MPSTQRTRKSADRDPPPGSPWEALGLAPPLIAALARVKFLTPTEIQQQLIPHALAGRDCLGQARTGTGKTAAFALPMLQRAERGGGVQGLVLVPTRELAVQVDDATRELAQESGIRTVAILGGRGIKQQVDALRQKPEIAIGTPGRVLDLMHRKALSLEAVRFVVLDEVDRMLDIGFRDEIRRILRHIEHPHQTVFVSATIDAEIEKLARSFMRDPVEVNVSRDMLTVEGIEQFFVSVHREDKLGTLLGLIKHEAPSLAIVFTRTKAMARRVAQHLKKEGINCKEIHGDLTQERRDRVMKAFRSQKLHVLVATDLASRGLDVMDISHIVNYDPPDDPSVYVHRIGRSARMGRSGKAFTFVTQDQGKLLTEIEKLINRELPRFDAPWLIKREPPPAAAVPPPPVEAPAAAREKPVVPSRYLDARQRDRVLDALGLRPIRRTLGSRFRSPRRRR